MPGLSMKNEKLQQCWELLFRNTELLQDLIGKCYPVRQYAQITVSQVKMCICICRHEPDGVMLKDLAEELELTPGAVSQTVENLVRMGFVERGTAEKDRRAVCIKLSPEGRKMRVLHENFFNVLAAAYFETVPQEKQEIFLEVLTGLYDYLKTEKAKIRIEK